MGTEHSTEIPNVKLLTLMSGKQESIKIYPVFNGRFQMQIKNFVSEIVTSIFSSIFGFSNSTRPALSLR